MKKRFFLAGAGGMLGQAFYKEFSKNYTIQCTDIDLNEKWLEYLDFREAEKYTAC